MNKFSKTFLIPLIFLPSFNPLFSQWSIAADFNGGNVNAIIVNDQEIYAGTSGQGIFRSDENGINWIQINSGLGNSLNVQTLSAKDNYIFAGSSSGGFFYSDNKGANWIQANQGLGQFNIKAIITDSSNVYAGCIFAGIFRSTNNGLNWSRFGLGEGDLLYTLSNNGATFFVGLDGGIYRSTNNGVNWSLAHSGLTNLEVRCILQTGNKTYCGTFGGGVFVSVNIGVLWTALSAGLSDPRILTLAAKGNNLFAAPIGKGIQYLNSSSGFWIAVNEGLTDTTFNSIAFNDQYIFAGSSAGKVWKRPLAEIVTDIGNNSSGIPEDFKLYQNFPNPFNPKTIINYFLHSNVNRESSIVKLAVYNSVGDEVAVLVNEEQNAGSYSVTFDGSNLPSGIYYYRIEAGEFTDTKKMVLLK